MSSLPSTQPPGAEAARTDWLLWLEELRVHHAVTRGTLLRRRVGTVRAVDGVTLGLRRGETLGLVGESGCGKSTLARAVMRLLPVTSGRVLFQGEDLLALRGEALRQRRRHFQMIFQDPFASLNPRLTLGDSVGEPLRALGEVAGAERERQVARLLERCGLSPELAHRLPHACSGGQRQRAAIARALALRPALVVADEPVSALDVSIRAQVLNLLVELQRDFGLTYLFISHDLAAVRHVSDRIAVMYLGRVVELASAEQVSGAPAHPYSQALASAVPLADPVQERGRRRIVLRGEVPSALSPPEGCRFHPRCPLYARLGAPEQARCRGEEPALRTLRAGHEVACHWAEAVSPSRAPSTGASSGPTPGP